MGAIKDSQWEYRMVPPLLPVLWQYLFIKSLFKNAFDSVINSTSGNLLQGKKSQRLPKDLCTEMFPVALFIVAEILEVAQMSSSD